MNNQQTKAIAITAFASVIVVCATALMLFGSQDTQTRVLEAIGALGAIGGGGGIISYLLRDADGDGVPDILQRGQVDDESE